jgi:hypothetical protein
MKTTVKASDVLRHFETVFGPQNIVRPDSEKAQDFLKDMADFPSEPFVIVQPSSNEQVSQVLQLSPEVLAQVSPVLHLHMEGS